MDIREAEVSARRREHWKLLSRLKTTVEGLLSTDNPNVWTCYGGLQRLHKDMNNILSHGLKQKQVHCKQKDYWRFVWCVRYICPQLAFHVEQFSQLEPELASGIQSSEEVHKAEQWLLHSLQENCLSAQLRPLLRHRSHTRKYYSDEAFVLSEMHVSLMLLCLEAVEQKDPELLARVDALRLSHLRGAVLGRLKSRSLCLFPGPHLSSASDDSLSDGTHEAPWACEGEEEECTENAAVPQIWLTEPGSPVLDPASGITEQGKATRRLTASLQQRRASYSEGQSEPGRSHKGHTRSLSDTSVTQKHSNESAEEVCSVQDYGPFSQNINISTSSLSMNSDSQSSNMSDDLFCRPLEGQSLLSYLSELDFGSCAEIEKENAHFSISESLIAAIELLKCSLEERDEGEGDMGSDCRIQQLYGSRLQPSVQTQRAFPSTDSGGSEQSSQDSLHLLHLGSAEEVEQCELTDMKHVTCLSRKSSLSSEPISPSPQSNSAESVAMGLLRQFQGVKLPAASNLDWLVPEQDAPQKHLPISDSIPISPDDGEHADVGQLHVHTRGNRDWTPPRPEIIFNIHPTPKRKVIVAKQNYLCAGCGTRTDPGYIKRLRYCEYLGKYFCQCCHENAQVVVPGRVLRKWDFTKYPVSNFARDLLSKIAADPLFNLADINSSLYKKVKGLETVRLLRVQLFQMKNMLKTCQLAKDVLDEFDSLPDHLTEDLHIFSLNDLGTVRHGELVPQLRELLRLGSMHVAACEVCQTKGIVCEVCGDDRGIIFPFELKKCQHFDGETPLVAGGPSAVGTPSAHFWRDWKFPLPGRLTQAVSHEGTQQEKGEEEEDGKEVKEKEDKGKLWKISHASQLAKAFSVDREKGEGGSSAEERNSQTEQRKSLIGGLAKVFSRGKGGSGEEELGFEDLVETGGVKEAEMRCDREVESQTERAERNSNTEQHHIKDKEHFLKALKVEELSKVFSRERKMNRKEVGDVRGQGEEDSESMEPDKEERRELVDVNRRIKAFFQDIDVEVVKEEFQIREGKDEEGVSSNSMVKRESSSGKIWKAPKPIKLPKIFLRDQREKEGVGCVGVTGEGQSGEEGHENVEPVSGAYNWRARRTRKARRMRSGRGRNVSEDKPAAREEEEEGPEEGAREGS